MDDELIGVVPRKLLRTLAASTYHDIPAMNSFMKNGGFYVNPERASALIWRLRTHIEYLPRKRMETSPKWKQLIPYIVVTKGHQVFVTRRLPKGGESRLHGKISVGIGGHINDGDKKLHANPIWGGMWRELGEELCLPGCKQIRPVPIGVVNHDQDPVGKVHIGLVFHAPVNNDAVIHVKETDQLQGKFVSWRELPIEEMEIWTRMLYSRYPCFLQ